MDRILIARPCLHCMQRGKNVQIFYQNSIFVAETHVYMKALSGVCDQTTRTGYPNKQVGKLTK